MSAGDVLVEFGGSGFRGPLRGSGSPLESGTLSALDEVQQVLTLHPAGTDRFRADNEIVRFGRLFGGQLIAQAMTAAAATITGFAPHSIHASFLRPGEPSTPLDITVDRTRDGRTMSTRQVTVGQGGRTLLTATVSFDTNPESVDDATVPTPAPAPESLPLLQHWAQQATPELSGPARTWIDTPPPLEIRTADVPIFLGGAQVPGPRVHWMRLPRAIDGGPQAHAVLLAYASDYLLVDTALRAHPQRVTYGTHLGLTLDHAVWLHRPVHFDRWHCYTQRTVGVGGDRALVHGTIVDIAGRHVASTAQEVLVRPRVGPAPGRPS